MIVYTVIIICSIILIIYIIGSINSGGSVLNTVWNTTTKELEADNIYYLPTAFLSIKATAKVITRKDAATGIFINANLAELVLDTSVQVVPDTSTVFGIKHKSSLFSSDDLKISVNSFGLLESINLTEEDRIANIISGVTDAPKIILSGQQAAESNNFKTSENNPAAGLTVITETKEYMNNFFILTKEIRTNIASRSWIINIDGTANINTTVDASFTLKFNVPHCNAFSFNKSEKVLKGVLTRPLLTVIMSIYKDRNSSEPNAEYQISIPDESMLVTVPIIRAGFIKKVYGIKLSNGMLLENAINHPSQIEGFVGIPIKIAKALISIPAQILSLKIENIKRQTTLKTEQQNLSNVEFQARKTAISNESELLKAKLETQKTMLIYEGEINKTKLDADKALLEAQKNIMIANRELATGKKDWENAKKELSDLLQQINAINESKFKIEHAD